jgi:nonsense-mediated mRNA decay protein 3
MAQRHFGQEVESNQFTSTKQILCCECGLLIPHNPANMCVDCLRSRVDITSDIGTEVSMYQCQRCNKYLAPPWIEADLESRELMAVCLKKIPGLKHVKMVDASWVWTEPHSKRLKVKLTVQKEVMNGAILQQSFIVEYIIKNQQCEDCNSLFSNLSWRGCCQVRQRADHKRTFFYVEQLILKHRAHEHCCDIQEMPDGMDFFFKTKQGAWKFADFMNTIVPCTLKNSEKMIGIDNHSNTGNFKYTVLAMIAPPCKDDLIVLPKRCADALGSINSLALVTRVCAEIHLVDPHNNQRECITGERYWDNHGKINIIMSSKRMIEFTVLDVTPCQPEGFEGRRMVKTKAKGRRLHQQLAEVEVAKTCDLGVNDRRYTCRTHLGNLLTPGDFVMGFDVSAANPAEDSFKFSHLIRALPECVLVRKRFETLSQRKWRLKGLEIDDMNQAAEFHTSGEADVLRSGGAHIADIDIGKMGGKRTKKARSKEAAKLIENREVEYEKFMQDLEEDKELRSNVNLYKKESKHGGGDGVGEDQDEEFEDENPDAVQLDELLDDLQLDDAGACRVSRVARAGLPAAVVVRVGGGVCRLLVRVWWSPNLPTGSDPCLCNCLSRRCAAGRTGLRYGRRRRR